MRKINPTAEGAIMNAIAEAKRTNQEIVSIGISKAVQSQIIKSMGGTGKEKLESIFGIPVKRSARLTITLQIY